MLALLLVIETALTMAPSLSIDSPLASAPLLSPLPAFLRPVFAAIIPRSAIERPTYQHIRLLRRLFADFGVALTQLAGVWADPPKSPPEEAINALSHNLAQETLNGLADELMPIMNGNNDKAGLERNLFERMENVFLNRELVSHPAVGDVFSNGMERELGFEEPPTPPQPSGPVLASAVYTDSYVASDVPYISTLGANDLAALEGVDFNTENGANASEAEIVAAMPLPPNDATEAEVTAADQRSVKVNDADTEDLA